MVKEKKRKADISTKTIKILEYVSRGYKDKEIAEELNLSINTIQHAIKTALRDTCTVNRCQLTAWAFRNKVLK